ncbi:UDP-N-acetylglucosamine 2-epimerase [Tropicibacter naphthalenivorans]|uniref:Polysialic acid biosynthesis protein P7 n=1 Tax=Tropicibacter naphthalenivorans TaxID=441103 RepID=A0A0P1GK84_9RHOB|nr:UDP-N-acetylglucosamine 2-epimerase [Tropicibacter naphthalenivorans]CUH82389.1 Polysialic acid biosynthesis protein P7 [Tropicibacter naphthalenivorans]SMD05501.1 UDP-N-acetylglucosamine 2-epimerase (non-hydrolysing) [Tropicibacter naphthalenivorans]
MKVLAVSGTRADWGLLQPVLTLLRDDPRFALEILVTGQHLMAGSTSVAAIEAAGFTVDHRVDMGLTEGDSDAALCAATGRAVAGVGAVLAQTTPDLMLILGDRYEILGAVTAALLSKVPVAHIAGGDVTEGAFDDSIRHAMTKMSALHFTTTEEAAARVRQMGEMPQNVFVTGSPGIDQVVALPRMERAAFFDSVGLPDQRPTFVITLHPATLSRDNAAMAQAMLDALDAYPQAGLIFTGSNADPGAAELDAMVQAYVAGRDNAVFHASLGSARYFSALEHCDLVLGNSSSGLYEAPSFQIPTVNIGDRQARRVRAASVIDCAPDEGAIRAAIDTALTGDWSAVTNPYGAGDAAPRILSHLAAVDDPAALIRKSFEDMTHGCENG